MYKTSPTNKATKEQTDSLYAAAAVLGVSPRNKPTITSRRVLYSAPSLATTASSANGLLT